MGTSGPQAPLGAAVGSSQHGRRPPPLSMHIGHRGCGHLSPVGLRPAASMELEQKKKKKKTLKKKAPVAGHDREDIGFRWPDPPRFASEQSGGGHSKSSGSKFFRACRAWLASVVLYIGRHVLLRLRPRSTSGPTRRCSPRLQHAVPVDRSSAPRYRRLWSETVRSLAASTERLLCHEADIGRISQSRAVSVLC